MCQQAYEEFKTSWKKLGNREFNINKIFKRQKVELNKIEEGLTIMSLTLRMKKVEGNSQTFLNYVEKLILLLWMKHICQ